MNRALRLLLPIAVAACVITPLAAQQSFSESLTFLKAVRNRDASTVQNIISQPSSGAINTRDPRNGEAALHILVEQRNTEWLNVLLAHGARPDIQRNDGSTPLGMAAQIGWADGANLLLARGANVNLANNRGETPLILAVQARQLPAADRLAIVRVLMARGADPNRQDSFAGQSALEYARQDSRAPEIAQALQQRQQTSTGDVYGPTP